MMLDTYWWGNVERISPEAPVPVVAVSRREQRIGGAGNVALNVKALGAEVHAISILGEDMDADILVSLLEANTIGTAYLLKRKERITTNKIRIISRNQHMMRLDAEITTMLSTTQEMDLIASVENFIKSEKPQIIILEDYNKGILTTNVIERLIELCRSHNILTAVDPKRVNFFAYRHVDIFKPNLHEAREGLNIISGEVNSDFLSGIHSALFEKLQHRISFITLSERGVFIQSDKEQAMIPTHIRSIADVSGAGDTVIAVASVIYAATQDAVLMAEISNIAGGLVCEEVGTVAINKNKLLEECNLLLR